MSFLEQFLKETQSLNATPRDGGNEDPSDLGGPTLPRGAVPGHVSELVLSLLNYSLVTNV